MVDPAFLMNLIAIPAGLSPLRRMEPCSFFFPLSETEPGWNPKLDSVS